MVGWKRCDHENLRGRPGYIITREKFQSEQKKEESSTLKIFTSDPVCSAQPSSTLSYVNHTHILGYKRNEKEADCIFIHQCKSSLSAKKIWIFFFLQKDIKCFYQNNCRITFFVCLFVCLFGFMSYQPL